MARTFPITSAIVLVLAAGLAQGLWSHRWTASREIASAVARLDHVPMTVGDWEGHEVEFDRRQLEMAQISGHLVRKYTKRDRSMSATIMLVCGPTGPISVHTPDICYPGAGYELEAAPVRYDAPSVSSSRLAGFLLGDFRKQDPTSTNWLRIYWSWNASGNWAAPDNPRPFFAGSQVLYKLYVIRESTVPLGPAGSDAGAALIRDLLPELDRALAPDRQPGAPGHS